MNRYSASKANQNDKGSHARGVTLFPVKSNRPYLTSTGQKAGNTMEKTRESFVFYNSFSEAATALPDMDRLALYDAITSYALKGECPVNLTTLANAMFTLIKPQLDANKRKFENGKKGGGYGKLGGRPKKEKPLENPTGVISENPELTPNVNVNVNVNDNGKEITRGKRLVPFLQEVLREQHSADEIAEMPDSFIPDDFATEWSERFPEQTERMIAEWEKFVRHFTGADCKRPVRKDWQGTWLNWITR